MPPAPETSRPRRVAPDHWNRAVYVAVLLSSDLSPGTPSTVTLIVTGPLVEGDV